MHEVVQGAAQKSWGVHVARLAGVPETVLTRAEALLKAADNRQLASAPLPLFAAQAQPAPGLEVAKGLLRHIADTDPDALTPREALAKLYQFQEEARHVRAAVEENLV